MKTEQIIKKQARGAMRGNMSKLIAAAGLASLVLLLLEYLEYLVLYIGNAVNLDTGEVKDGYTVFYLLTVSGFAAAALFASPLLNGFLRMSADTAIKKECRSVDVFYYFKGGRLYFKTILFNLVLYLMYASASSALNLSGILSWLLPDIFAAEMSLRIESVLTVFVSIVTVILRIIVFLIFAYYPLLAYAIKGDMRISCIFKMLGFSIKHFSQAFRLTLSFAGWFALCFFVVPVIYVAPYFAVSSAMSARWLLELDGSGREV